MSAGADVLPLLGASFASLADALAGVAEGRWAEPSLCTGWSVATVVAHLTMAARYDEAAFAAELATDAYDFATTSDRLALRDGRLPLADLLRDLRSATMARFATPGGGLVGSLSHVVIHGLDATWPLGLGRTCSDAAVVVVLDMLTSSSPSVFGVEHEGLALRASDVAWSYGGQGDTVERPAAELVLALSGRENGGALVRPAR